MGHDDRREILERLEALERMAHSRRDERGGRDHDRHGRHGGHRDHGRDRHGDRHDDCHHDHSGNQDDFDEKRVIDTIVHLVSERVAHMLETASGQGYTEAAMTRNASIDLIVGLVSEHVGETWRSELDRRLGPATRTPATRRPNKSGSGGARGG